ncbi:MAG: hypothetical protein ACK42Z_07225 [Candidatus Kapaibacteriota bacterium]
MFKLPKDLSYVDIYRTGVLGGLWSFIEITFGTWLHSAKIPFRGLILSLVAASLLAFAKNILHYRGSLIMLGLITITIKTSLTGVFILNPIIAIFLESIFAEFTFLVFKPNLFSSMLCGASVLFYTFMHSVIAQIFFFGFDIIKVYVAIIGKFIQLPIEKSTYALILVLGYLLIHVILGTFAGLFGFKLSEKTKLILLQKYENN